MKNKVLIIDDMPFNIRLLEQILEDEGYEVYSICDDIGTDIIYKIIDIMPSIIIIDIMLHGINGYEICNLVKNHPKIYSIPVIMLSAMSDQISINTSIEAGAFGYISKPFDEDKIILMIGEAIEGLKNGKSTCIIIEDNLSTKYSKCLSQMENCSFSAKDFYNKVNKDTEFFREIIVTFEDSSVDKLKQIKNDISNNDVSSLKQTLHALKSMLLYFNAVNAIKIIDKININNFKDAMYLYDRLEIEIVRINFLLKEHLLKLSELN